MGTGEGTFVAECTFARCERVDHQEEPDDEKPESGCLQYALGALAGELPPDPVEDLTPAPSVLGEARNGLDEEPAGKG